MSSHASWLAYWRYAALGSIIVVGVAGGWKLIDYRQAAEHVDLGRSLYLMHCAVCHGASLQGQQNWKEPLPNGRMPAPPHDATGHTWHHSDQELFKITKEGLSAVVPDYENDMPAFGARLSDDEISAVLAYVKSTWPEQERDYQLARTRTTR